MQGLLKDNLGLEPAQSQALLATAAIPWAIKPLYGLLSDYIPIMGRKRQPYIFGAGLVGTAAWSALAWVAHHAAAETMAGCGDDLAPEDCTAARGSRWSFILLVLALMGNVSTAAADVVVDAMVAEHSKGTLPSLWRTFSCFGSRGMVWWSSRAAHHNTRARPSYLTSRVAT
jgi:hypothetical protein